MIKINLLVRPKEFKIPVVMGLDIRMFRFKMLFIAYLLSFSPDLIRRYYFKIEKTLTEKRIAAYRKKINKYNKILRDNRAIKLKVEAFEKQAKKLKSREKQVLAIIKQRTNPFKVLTKLAQVIPDKVWLNSVRINRKEIELHGHAADYKSIGGFIDSLNNTIFFNKSIKLEKTESQKMEFGHKTIRVEKFSLMGDIERFD